MKWLKFLKTARKRAHEGAAEAGVTNEFAAAHKHSKRRSLQHERKERTSIEQWHEARKSRTSIDICSAFNVPTTERLSVCKAGITILINRTYIVIKHLGSGSSGQVKLAFNLRSKKLVAIKAVRKGGASQLCGGGGRDTRSYDGRACGGAGRSHGGGGGHFRGCSLGGSQAHSGCGSGSVAAGGGGGRGWRSITPSSLLRRSPSSNAGSWSGVPGSAAASSQSALRSFFSGAAGAAPGPAAAAAAAAAQPPPAAAPAAPTRPPPEELVREIAILKRLSHPNIVQLVEVIDDPASDCLLLVMGYVEGSTLQPPQLAPGRWHPVPEQQVWRQARDVLCGLEYLHCHGVVHGDLKPANFIQDSLTGVVRILDFGSAVLTGRMLGEEGLRGAHGPMSCTPGFRSPESLAAGYRPSFELDMWALGVCLYLWAFGELPFKGSAPFVVYENIRSAPLAIPDPAPVSAQLLDLITRLLDKDPQARMGVQQAVQHPWVTAQGLAPLRITSPLVMAARMQLAAAAAQAAGCLPLPPPPAAAAPPAQDQEGRGMEVEEEDAGRGMQVLWQAHAQECTQQQELQRPQPGRWAAAAQTAAANRSLTARAHALPSDSNSSFNLASSAAGGGADTASDMSDVTRGGGGGASAAAMWVDSLGEPWLASAASAPPPRLPVHRIPSASAGRSPSPQPPAGGYNYPWVTATAPSSGAAQPPSQSPPPAAAAALAAMLAAADREPPEEAPWRMAAGGGRGGTAAGVASGCGMLSPILDSPALCGPGGGAMYRITEGTTGTGTGAAAAERTASPGTAAGLAAAVAAGGSTGGRRKSCEAWELRRSVTEEELQAAISSCCDPAGSAAVLMESIFSEVTFPAKQEIIRAGDPLDRIYLITAGEVELYHDLAQDGPDAPCPHKPIIEGLSDPESDLDDPGTFLNLRLPGMQRVPQLERLSTGLLNATGGAPAAPPHGAGSPGGDRSNHGASPAPAPASTAAAAVGGPSARTTGSGLLSFLLPGREGTTSARNTLTGLGGGGGGGGRQGGGGGTGGGMVVREPSGSLGLMPSRAPTQAGHLIVATKGPGDSLGFAGMLPSGAGGGCAAAAGGSGGEAGRQPVWSANVRARTQVTAFAASIASLHKLARTHPQVEPLLQQMAVQQETDLAVAEAMRSLRLVGGASRAAVTSAAGRQRPAAAAGSDVEGTARTVPEVPASGCIVIGGGGAGGGGLAGGMSSEGENESCGTAGTTATGLAAVSGTDPRLLPRLAVFTAMPPPAPTGVADAAAAAACGGAAAMDEDAAEAEPMDTLL